ncbi:hypothetical protein AAHH67_15500 [Niallia circulans]
MLVYKSRSHSKTIELIHDVLDDAKRLKGDNQKGMEQLSITKTPMSEYHLGYIIEKLESEGFRVEFTQGINQFHFHISWDNELTQKEILINALKEIEALTRNPREYEPSYYSINHIAREAIEGVE